MLTANIKLAPLYHCNVTLDDATLKLLQAMDAEGRLAMDRFRVEDNRAVMVLNPREINRLRLIGIHVSVGQVLLF